MEEDQAGRTNFLYCCTTFFFKTALRHYRDIRIKCQAKYRNNHKKVAFYIKKPASLSLAGITLGYVGLVVRDSDRERVGVRSSLPEGIGSSGKLDRQRIGITRLRRPGLGRARPSAREALVSTKVTE